MLITAKSSGITVTRYFVLPTLCITGQTIVLLGFWQGLSNAHICIRKTSMGSFNEAAVLKDENKMITTEISTYILYCFRYKQTQIYITPTSGFICKANLTWGTNYSLTELNAAPKEFLKGNTLHIGIQTQTLYHSQPITSPHCLFFSSPARSKLFSSLASSSKLENFILPIRPLQCNCYDILMRWIALPPIRAESLLMALTKGWPGSTGPVWSVKRKTREKINNKMIQRYKEIM